MMQRGGKQSHGGGLGWKLDRFCSPWYGALRTWLSFLPGNLSAQMESTIRSFVSFPKHTTRSLPV